MMTDATKQPETGTVEVETEDQLEIEVYDDRPEQDQREPVDLDELDESDDEDLTDEEIAALGKRTQQRIKKLTFKYNEARRQAEEQARIARAALEDARRTRALATQAQGQNTQYQEALLKQRTESSTAAVTQAKAALQAAYEEGDPAKIADAQESLTEAKMMAAQTAQAQRYFDSRQTQTKESPPAAQQDEGAPSAAPAIPKPSSAAQEWAGRNPWFGKDEELTSLAYGIHERWVRQGRIPDTPEYYAHLDSRIRELVPARFSNSGSGSDERRTPQSSGTPRTSPVTPASRTSSSAGGNGKVRLSRSEVKTAERMGIPLEVYAREKLKYERQQEGV